MITKQERDMVFAHAYIPEHLPDYVQAVSLAEPHLHERYVCFSRDAILIFIGYPLQAAPSQETGEDLPAALESAYERFQPTAVSVIAPGIPPECHGEVREADRYYRVNLPLDGIRPEEAYMVRRARRDLSVRTAAFGKDHTALIEDFIAQRDLSVAQQEIFRCIPGYLYACHTARLLEARKEDELVAFTVLDLGSADYCFYMFNFRSCSGHVPGASDLLFCEMAEIAAKDGKRFLNLGLGVNPGIRRFKEKWGAVPFVPYQWATIERKRPGLLARVRKMIAEGM
jgi:hypothetical protein